MSRTRTPINASFQCELSLNQVKISRSGVCRRFIVNAAPASNQHLPINRPSPRLRLYQKDEHTESSPDAVLLVGRVVLRELLQQRHLLLCGLAHGVVVADHLERYLRGASGRRRPRSITQDVSTDVPKRSTNTQRTGRVGGSLIASILRESSPKTERCIVAAYMFDLDRKR